jgi:hypothetical protein
VAREVEQEPFDKAGVDLDQHVEGIYATASAELAGLVPATTPSWEARTTFWS